MLRPSRESQYFSLIAKKLRKGQEGKKGKGLGEPRSGADDAKTDAVVRDAAIVPVARRRTTIPRRAAPGTATYNPCRAFIAR